MRFVIQSVIGVSIVLCHALSWAQIDTNQASINEYYGSEFMQAYKAGQLKDETLVQNLFKIISARHTSLGYDGARRELFGKIFLEKATNGWVVKDVYCEKTYTSHDGIGPGMVPSPNEVNTEHTWPQSRFTNRFSKDMQKSDLHHLFPTDSEMNSARSSLRFGDVVKDVDHVKCPISHLGHSQSGEVVFEVPDEQKGNTARAIFYFATRYQMKISPTEEAALRRWNEKDPVDAEEAQQNDAIQKVQGNRNPFIDFPDLLTKIRSFNQPVQNNPVRKY